MAGRVGPRQNYMRDEHYFMTVALLTAQRSPDPRTQMGACIVKDDKLISTGYNHMPSGNDKNTWGKDDPTDNKFLYVYYAVNDAISNAHYTGLNGATVYSTHYPSDRCANDIIKQKIAKVVYLNPPDDPEKPIYKASKKMLEEREKKIIVERFSPQTAFVCACYTIQAPDEPSLR